MTNNKFQMTNQIQNPNVKKYISFFFHDLLHNWQVNKLLNELNESREEIRAGKGKVLKSLKYWRS